MLPSSPFTIIPPILHTNLHLNITLIRRTSGRNLSVIVEHWEKQVLTRCRLRSSKVKRYARKRLRRLTMASGVTAEIPFHFQIAMRPVDPPQRPWEKCRLAEFLLVPQTYRLDPALLSSLKPSPHQSKGYCSVSQTVVRGPQVVLGFCPCGTFRLNISPKKTEKIKLT